MLATLNEDAFDRREVWFARRCIPRTVWFGRDFPAYPGHQMHPDEFDFVSDVMDDISRL